MLLQSFQAAMLHKFGYNSQLCSWANNSLNKTKKNLAKLCTPYTHQLCCMYPGYKYHLLFQVDVFHQAEKKKRFIGKTDEICFHMS